MTYILRLSSCRVMGDFVISPLPRLFRGVAQNELGLDIVGVWISEAEKVVGQPPAGEVLLATVLDEAPGDVVAEPLPVFLFGVARRQPVPGLVEELAGQRGTGCAALRRASPRFGSPCLQLRLDRVPELRSDDRWMLALVDTPLVPDAAGVERIGQQAVEVSATERQPACPGSISGEALLGAQPQTVRLGWPGYT